MSQSGNEEYVVEKILDVRKKGKRTEFYVKWKGYDEEDSTWEPAIHLLPNCKDMIEDFEKQYKQFSKELNQKNPKTSNNGSAKQSQQKLDEENNNNSNKSSENLKEFIEQSSLKRKGCFDLGDVPDKIRKAIRDNESNEIKMEIMWKFNEKEQIQPHNTVYSNLELRKYNKDIMLDYYESKITFKGSNTK